MGKTNTAKNPPDDFKVTIPKIPLLSQQAVTSKGISVSYTNFLEQTRMTLTLDLETQFLEALNIS